MSNYDKKPIPRDTRDKTQAILDRVCVPLPTFLGSPIREGARPKVSKNDLWELENYIRSKSQEDLPSTQARMLQIIDEIRRSST